MALRTEEAGRTSSLGKAIFQQNPQRDDPVAPRNFFAFIVTTAVVGNRHFVDTDTRA